MPKSNAEYWTGKIDGNVKRDLRTRDRLEDLGMEMEGYMGMRHRFRTREALRRTCFARLEPGLKPS